VLKRTRLALGWTSLATGLSGLAFGLLAPLTFGLTFIPAAFLTAAGVMLGHASLSFLTFEIEVAHMVENPEPPSRFGRLPRDPAPPRLVAASPLGLSFVF
jgi:hypothetical protein